MKTAENMNKKISYMTASLHNLGCKVNQYETDALGQMLKEVGVTIVEFGQKADITIINTCSVTNIADQKSRQMINRARRINPECIVVAAGCYVQTKENLKPGDLGADILLGNNEKSKLIDCLEKFIENREKQIYKVEDTNTLTEYERLEFSEESSHTRAFVKVEDGCNAFCSYCIIPYARGRVRSRTVADAVFEAKKLAEKGYKEIVLSGIHLPSFGMDTGENLLDLIKAIHKIDDIKRIRLGSLEPRVITREFAEEISKLEKLAPHFHLSLQSGCDATLKRMNRKYSAAEYKEKCDILREVYDNPALTTDVICGFPGETPEEFEESYNFVKDIGFYEMHVFKYSRRHGTVADRLPDQIAENVKTERSKRLIELSEKMSEAYIASMKGKRAEIILEDEAEEDGEKGRVGFSAHYIKTFVPGDNKQGEIVDVIL